MCQAEEIKREHIPLDLQARIKSIEPVSLPKDGFENLPQAVASLERQLLRDALEKTAGNKRKAAHLLGLTERVLGYKVKQYNLV